LDITTDLESRELEGALGDEHPAVVEPPLRPELLGVGAPQELHPAHLVRLVVHHVPFVDGVAVRQRVVRKAALDILQHQHPTRPQRKSSTTQTQSVRRDRRRPMCGANCKVRNQLVFQESDRSSGQTHDGHSRVEPEGLRQRCVQVVHLADGVVGQARDELRGAEVAVAGGGGGAHLLGDLVLDVLVPAQHVEEPRQRPRRGVAAGDHEVEDDVPQVLVVEAAGIALPLHQEPRQDVLFLGLSGKFYRVDQKSEL